MVFLVVLKYSVKHNDNDRIDEIFSTFRIRTISSS